MECTDEFKYGKGTFAELRSGNVEMHDFDRGNVRTVFDMENIENKLVVVPWAVGIYQSHKHMPESYEEQEEIGDIEEFDNVMSGLLGSLTNLPIKQLTGKDDTVNEGLINVIYDPNIFPNESIVRDNLRDNVNRVGISPYTNIPDFFMILIFFQMKV